MLEYHIIARNREEAVQVAMRTAQVNRERYGRVQNVYPEPRVGPDRWVVILESGQSQGNLGWQPLVEGVSKLTAVDYSAYYKEQGYEVKVVPNKRNPDRLDMYIRKIEQSAGNPGNPQQTIWYAGIQLTWDGQTYQDKDLNYLQQMIDATRARGKKAAVTHHGNNHYFYYEM